jgi:hypothetical protein
MSGEERNFRVDIHACIDPTCSGEVHELEYYELNNWVTAVFRCVRCGREFTVKLEL